MRLEKIKLAGFKSFVEPATIVFPKRLIGVVGPNGCGKSNIIDAVRWVMGESSAKHLRGSAMADVIFNGSTNRKPVGLASVELIFDNSEGRLGGEYARYAQIALKRQVTRDGQSHYFLNGTRCRRRDIMDVFLGTGLGPRSYAIIEQGMVSRFIEAKPEELRLFIEEAAGLSKYKERRHETELKLQHTRDNLERLEDIRSELTAQVKRLERQAKKAEKYRQLNHAIEHQQQELIAIKWREAADQHQRNQTEIEQLQRAVRDNSTALEQAQAELNRQRQAVEQRQAELNRLQAQLYDLNSAISHCDQTIRHSQKTLKEREQSLAAWREELKRSEAAIDQDSQQQDQIQAHCQQLEIELEQLRSAEAQALEQRRQCDRDWQVRRRELAQKREELSRLREQLELTRVEIRHLEQTHEQSRKAQTALQQELDQLHQSNDASGLTQLEQSLAAAEQRHHQQTVAISEQHQAIQTLRQTIEHHQQQLQKLHNQQSQIQGEITALETLQRHALGKDKKSLQKLLANFGIEQAPRLGELVEARAGWEKAVEVALSDFLEAVCVEDLALCLSMAERLQQEDMTLIDLQSGAETVDDGVLATQIQCRGRLQALLAGARCCQSLTEAFQRRQELAAHEFWITPEGDRVGQNWLKLHRAKDKSGGILERQKTLRELHSQLTGLAEHQQQHRASLTETQSRLAALEHTLEQLRRQEREDAREASRLQAELAAAKARAEENRQRIGKLRQFQQESENNLTRLQQNLADHRNRLQTMESQVQLVSKQLEQLQNDNHQARAAFEQADTQTRQLQTERSKLEAALEHSRKSMDLLQQQAFRAQKHRDQLLDQLQRAQQQQAEGKQPLQAAQQEMEELLARRQPLEQALGECREALKLAESQLQEQQARQQQSQTQLEHAKKALEQGRLDAEAARVKLVTIEEQAQEANSRLEAVLSRLPAEADAKTWQTQLERLKTDQARLGDVNLTAIEEHCLHSERLRFLDKQHADLNASVEMLEKAIRKIDRESRSRFKETFEAVDGHFRQRFPALFGGGEGHLEVVGDDLLDAGVKIVARPPGKRNSSIHLLSGGEKALTAVALVFSFFELNPAPFCLLDEVDAPLDEANVGRYCQLLQSMSERVQFIFISHNKTTMEIAEQLIGVTMGEPGVSRIVAVDLEKAAAMAAA